MLAIEFGKFQLSGLPVKLPEPDDFPCTGWVSHEDVKTVDAVLATATYSGNDDHVRDVINAMRGWFRNAATKGWRLVCYYH